MQFRITRPDRNVGREDRLIRAVLAGCLLMMSAFGLLFHGPTLIAAAFGLSGGYGLWSAVTARCFAYRGLAIDTRSEAEALADAQRELARAADSQIDLTTQAATPADGWGHPVLGK